MESEAHKTLLLLQQVAELERIVGQKQLEIDFSNKLMELATEELGNDAKKKKHRSEAIEWFRLHRQDHGHEMKSVYLKLKSIQFATKSVLFQINSDSISVDVLLIRVNLF
ncbi:MAG: hypothetical protein HY842_04120 [Bacteroidetes bacterium]|nr:hypothetical protein [Bacteroidota bacterium]